jgi:glutamine amidotransferase
MNRVALVDYGLSNLDSVRRAVEEVGGRPYVVAAGSEMGEPNHVILPGVGAFGDGIRNLQDRDLVNAIADQVHDVGVPLLGICLGMQLLAEKGFEGGEHPGLGWIAGHVVRLEPTESDWRIPHVGWNEVHPTEGSPLFEGMAPGSDFYFVHSYHFVPDDPDDVRATTPYAGGFVSAVGNGLVFGAQFHPEKSQRTGFAVLRNFLAL